MAAMESLETLVAHIQAFTKPEELPQLQSLLKQSDEALRLQSANLPPLLSQLDPSKHSLGFLYLLDAYLCSSITREQVGDFLPSIAEFLKACSAHQIRLASDKCIFFSFPLSESNSTYLCTVLGFKASIKSRERIYTILGVF